MTAKQLKSASVVGPECGVRPATLLGWYRRGWVPGYRGGQRPVLFNTEEVQAALARRADTQRLRQGVSRGN